MSLNQDNQPFRGREVFFKRVLLLCLSSILLMTTVAGQENDTLVPQSLPVEALGNEDSVGEYDFLEDYGLILLPVSVRETLPSDFFSDTFLSYRLSALLTHTLPQSIYQLESTGAFSFADGELYSLYGNSWLWNRTYYNAIETTSAFFSGRSLHKFLPIGHGVTFDGLKGTRDYHLETTGRDITYLGISVGNLGPAIPYYHTSGVENIHKAAQTREVEGQVIAPEGSNSSLGAGEGFQRFHLPIAADSPDNSNFFVLDLFYHIGEREFSQFDYTGWDGPYEETVGAITWSGAVSELTIPTLPNVTWETGFLTSFFTREHLGAEFYLREEETLGLTSFATTVYARSQGPHFSGSYALSVAVHELLTNNPNNLGYNVVRLTGEGLEPFDLVAGTVVELTPQATYAYTFDVYKEAFLKLGGETRLAMVTTTPEEPTVLQNVYFQDTNTNYSLYQSHYSQLPSTYAILEQQVTLSLNSDAEDWWQISLGFDVDGLLLDQESVARITPNFAVELEPVRTRWVTLGFLMGRENIPFSSEYARFISDDYRSAENYVWNDANDNLEVETGEVDMTTLYSTGGGKYQGLSRDFNQPHYYYIDIPFTVHFTKSWAYSLGAHYRVFKQAPWVCWEGEPTDYGEYSERDGTNVFFQTNGAKRYEICNLPETYFPSQNRNWFNNSPMYLGATMGFNGVGKRFVFSLTFTAYLINGVTRQGHGLVHNSLGFFETTMADPNNLLKPVGRYDADRSYLVRVFGSYAFLDNFIGTLTLSYRDGQPIGSWDYVLQRDGDGTQISWIRREVSGDNLLLYNGEFGTREDARWNIDLRLKWIFTLPSKTELELHLNVYNLVDLALETLEYAAYPSLADNRIALETEPPRSLEIIIKYFY